MQLYPSCNCIIFFFSQIPVIHMRSPTSTCRINCFTYVRPSLDTSPVSSEHGVNSSKQGQLDGIGWPGSSMCEGAFNWPGLRCLLHPTPGVSVGQGGIVCRVCDHPRVSAGQKLAPLSQLPPSCLCIRFNQSETAVDEEQGTRNGSSTWRSVKKKKKIFIQTGSV